MPNIHKALAILAALAFLLPFVTISCNGMKFVEMSGAKLAKCSLSTCSPDDMISPNLRAMAEGYIPKKNLRTPGRQGTVDFDWMNTVQAKGEVSGANYVVLAAIACLLAVGALFIGGRGGELFSGIVSVAAIVFLFIFRSKFGDAVGPHLQPPGANAAAAFIKIKIELQFASGFWASVILSAASAILGFKGTSGARNLVPGRVTPSSSRATSRCPACGSANPVGNKFCLACGGLLPGSPPSAPSMNGPGLSCPSCGATNVGESRFCLSCGKPLGTATAMIQSGPTATAGSQPEAKAVAAAAAPVAQPLPFSASIADDPPSTKTKVEIPIPAPPAPAEAAPSASTEQPKPQQACGKCDAALAPAQKFCLACGTPVGAAVTTLAASETPIQESAIFTPTSASPEYQSSPFQTPPRSGNLTWLIAAVLLAIVGVGGWLVWKYFAGPDVTVTTIPQRIHVAAGGKTLLQASVSGSRDEDVIWSIEEGAKGGQVTPLGAVVEGSQSRASATYTAPQAGGAFHVIATSHANRNRTAKIEIIVGASQAEMAAAATPASAAPPGTNQNAAQMVGVWRWPSDDMKMTVAADSTITVTSDADPQKNMHGTYHFADNSHVQVDFGNGDVRTWEILGVDSNYLRVLSQSKTESSSTALVFLRLGS